ncbi:heat shock factor protein 5-like [Passer domesticus]|uniref:heat shock factor protein 5-like n=1 Tax=Passer domesticus TaxID=48849 RepID=UPI0030FE7E17
MAELPLPAGLSASAFPAKLWRLVNSPRVRSVRWDRGGTDARLLPSHAFSSFVQQLNLYGFHKVPGWIGSAELGDAGGWLHFRNPNFRRDRPDLLLHMKRLTRANRQRLAAGLEVRSRQPSRFQQLRTERPLASFPAGQPPRAATPGTSGPSAPAGSAGFAPWTAPSWLWNTPGEEELPPPDLDMVLETLEEMFSPSAQGNINVAPESSGGQPVDRAEAEGALPATESCRNNSQEPEDFDFHLIYIARRAALLEKI